MNTWKLVIALAGALFISTAAGTQAHAQSNTVDVRRVHRQAIRSMNILDRPYRFGHFYGNTVRRLHYGRTTQRLRLRGR